MYNLFKASAGLESLLNLVQVNVLKNRKILIFFTLKNVYSFLMYTVSGPENNEWLIEDKAFLWS